MAQPSYPPQLTHSFTRDLPILQASGLWAYSIGNWYVPGLLHFEHRVSVFTIRPDNTRRVSCLFSLSSSVRGIWFLVRIVAFLSSARWFIKCFCAQNNPLRCVFLLA